MSDVNPENAEMELVGSETDIPGDERLARVLAAERSLWRSVWKWMVIATPICIVIWCLMVVIAVGPEDPADWFAWIGIGIIVGALAGGFFGAWAGFTAKAHQLDQADLPHLGH